MNPLQTLSRWLSTEVNYLFFRRYRHTRSVRRHLSKYYTPDAPRATNTAKMVVFMCDGRRHHGGLVDRLRSITSIYKYCADNGLDFRIHFVEPFALTDYLVPAAYDWRIDPTEVSYNSRDARPIYMTRSSHCGSPERERRFQLAETRHNLSKPFRQVHVYCQAFDFYGDAFSSLFGELFRPAPCVEAELMRHLQALGGAGHYISVSTRFLELLGDFKEPKATKTLTATEQQALIAACVAQVEAIRERHPEAARVLVTSDSSRFLAACAALPYVYVIPGEVVHVDVRGTGGDRRHLKTFTDFFAIARASHSYLLRTGDMYRSSFSLRAAQMGGHSFEVVEF